MEAAVSLGVTKMTSQPRLAVLLLALTGGGVVHTTLRLAREFTARGLAVDLLVCRLQGELHDAVPAGTASCNSPCRRQTSKSTAKPRAVNSRARRSVVCTTPPPVSASSSTAKRG